MTKKINVDAKVKNGGRNFSEECQDISALTWVDGSEAVEIEDSLPPNEVSNFSALNVQQESLILNWIASTSSDVKQYNIYLEGSLIGNTSETEFYVSSLNAGTQYTFTIKSVDINNNESSGVSLTITTENVKYFLRMSGEQSRLSAPTSLPKYNKVDLNVLIARKDNGDMFYAGGVNTFLAMSGGRMNINKVEINGVEVMGNFGHEVPIGVECRVTIYLTSSRDKILSIFGSNNSNAVPGNIYKVSVYYDENVIAYYDTSTGSVLDQSGNGYDANIVGDHQFIEAD